jgi:hypothetical protein
MLNHLQIIGFHFHTADGGAKGGHVRVMEMSGIGICDIVVPTPDGMTVTQVAAAVYNESARSGIPGPHRGCPASNNLRVVVDHGNGLMTTVFATGLRICSEDEGVGFARRPKNVHPTADAGPDQTIECVIPPVSVTLDGRASADSDGDALSYGWYTDYGGRDQMELASIVTLGINDLVLGV